MTEQDETRVAAAPMKRWVKVLLVLSLAANLAIIGIVIGASLRWHKHGHGGGTSFTRIMISSLDQDIRRDVRLKTLGSHEHPRDRRRADHTAILEVLGAEPFDPDTLRSLLSEQAGRRQMFLKSVQDAWFAQLMDMTPKDRQHYLTEVIRKLEPREAEHSGR